MKIKLLYFEKWNFLAPRLKNVYRKLFELEKQKTFILKKFLIFSQKSVFLYFRRWNFLALRLKKFLYFLKKTFSTFWDTELFLKTSYILGGNFTSSKKKKKCALKFFFIFREMELSKWNS